MSEYEGKYNKTLKIISPTEAREINDMLTVSEYQEFTKCGMEGLLSYEEAFIEAEDSLKTYRITNEPYIGESNGVQMFYIKGGYIIKAEVGSPHLCKVNDKDLTAYIL